MPINADKGDGLPQPQSDRGRSEGEIYIPQNRALAHFTSCCSLTAAESSIRHFYQSVFQRTHRQSLCRERRRRRRREECSFVPEEVIGFREHQTK